MLWPTRCASCDAAGPSPCRVCLRLLHRAPAGPPVPALDACHALLAYEGPARRLVTGLKYRNDRAALAWLADGMAALLVPPAGAVVTWAPTSGRRRRRRGFDQAELLAAAVARRWAVPCRRLLSRPGRPHPQTGRDAAQRRDGPRLRASATVRGPVIVVDDVVTTGATLREAGRSLRRAGAPWVAGLVAARTPRRPVADADPSWHSVREFPPGVDKSLKLATERSEYRW